MITRSNHIRNSLILMLGLLPLSAFSGVSQDKAAQLGESLTPTGAEAAANADGTIPAWSGKWLGAPPNIEYDGSYNPNPYPDEEPLFTITAENMERYADHLGEGQKALFREYPDTFRMNVYPTHRDFRNDEQWQENVKKNAVQADLANDGLTLEGAYGGSAFPIPESGLEIVYNILTSSPAWFIEAPELSFYVQPTGAVSKSWFILRAYTPYAKGDERDEWRDGEVFAYSITEEKAPPRHAGRMSLTANTFDHDETSRQAWLYDPGTRRIRKTPDIGFDFPMDTGPRVVDEQNGFNGSPERFDWKLIGKREIYVPFNNYELESRDIKYEDLIETQGHPNPDYIRYELRRVWVIEGTLKPTLRHIYSKRRFYVEEDSWFKVMGDMYDTRGELWRVSLDGVIYAYDATGYYNNVSIFHDLVSKAYSIEKVNNELSQSTQLNRREPRTGEFTPTGILRSAQ